LVLDLGRGFFCDVAGDSTWEVGKKKGRKK